MGGGSLMTPILVIVFGFQPTYAVGTDILHGAIFKTFGADPAPPARHRARAARAAGCSSAPGRCRCSASPSATWLTHHYGDGVQTIESYAIGAALVARRDRASC